jgi:hypothetical protein
MKERISRLAKGLVEYESTKPVISIDFIEERVKTGELTMGEFVVNSANETPIKGLIYSSNMRVKPMSTTFGGRKAIIKYEVNSKYLTMKDVISGEFCFITNCGEYKLPFNFKMLDLSTEGYFADITDIQGLTNLAYEDSDKIVRLFGHTEFKNAPIMKDPLVKMYYDTLSTSSNMAQAFEEFMVGIGAKERVKIKLGKIDIAANESESGTIELVRNSWGYVDCTLTCNQPYIKLLKTQIKEIDFIGDTCEINLFIDKSVLHAGKNKSQIIIDTGFDIFKVPIEIQRDNKTEISYALREYNAYYCNYLRLRLAYEAGVRDNNILNKMKIELNHMLSRNPNNLAKLLKAEINIEESNFTSAIVLLEEIRDEILKNRIINMEVYCFYQYIVAKVSENDDEIELAKLLHKQYDESPNNIYLLLLLLKISNADILNNEALFHRLRKQYKAGVNSPFLYQTACQLLTGNIEYLEELKEFETHILSYAIKVDLMTEALALRAAEIVIRGNYHNRNLYAIFTKLYDKYELDEILIAINTILIKSDSREHEDFIWYELGVLKELRITNLYEYYIYSLPETFKEPIPLEVLLYFSYSYSADKQSREKIYYNMVKYYEKDSPIYLSYVRSMEDFTLSALFESYFNENMLSLYKRFIYKDIIDERIATVFIDILSVNKVKLLDLRVVNQMKTVAVIYPYIKKKFVYTIEGDVAYLPIYLSDYKLVFEDIYGNLHVDIKYNIRSMSQNTELMNKCLELLPEHSIKILENCKKLVETKDYDEVLVKLSEKYLSDNIIRDNYAWVFTPKLIRYYSMLDEETESKFMASLNDKLLGKNDRKLYIEALIYAGEYSRVYNMLKEYGCEEIDKTLLIKVCCGLTMKKMKVFDSELLNICHYIFKKGARDLLILEYLCIHFNGTINDMYELLIVLIERNIKTYELPERILGQIMFAGSREYLDEVFRHYIKRGEVKELLVNAYFSIRCHDYFVNNINIDADIFEYIQDSIQKQIVEKKPDIWGMALTKYYSSLEELSEEQIQLCQNIITKMIEKGYIFEYMKILRHIVNLPSEFIDGIWVEYNSQNIETVGLKVRIVPHETEFKDEAMRHIYAGIYGKSVLLFEGEHLEYEIYDKGSDDYKILKSGSLVNDSAFIKVNGFNIENKFEVLNSLIINKGIASENEFCSQLQEYIIKNEMIRAVFEK